MPRFSGFLGVTIVVALASLLVAVLRHTVVWAEPVGSLTGMTICVDPGHPSETSAGCVGPSGYKEVTAVWEVGQKLKAFLQEADASVVLTKSQEDEHVTNRHRAEIANKAHADLMVRLHCDAGGSSGFAIYYPNRTGTRYGVTGPAQSVIKASRQAAEAFYRGMESKLQGILPGRGIHGDSATYVGSKQGALTGSIFSQVPVLCVEMVMLSNASDEKFIRSESGQKRMASALMAGIRALATSVSEEKPPAGSPAGNGNRVDKGSAHIAPTSSPTAASMPEVPTKPRSTPYDTKAPFSSALKHTRENMENPTQSIPHRESHTVTTLESAPVPWTLWLLLCVGVAGVGLSFWLFRCATR